MQSIASRGLLPNAVSPAQETDVNLVKAAMGGDLPLILCLSQPDNPVPSSANGLCIQLAVCTSHLPDRVGIDWSYASMWNLVEILSEEDPSMSLECVFLETFRRRGSIVVYDPIAPDNLLVRLQHSSVTEPWTWPRLLTVDDYASLHRAAV